MQIPSAPPLAFHHYLSVGWLLSSKLLPQHPSYRWSQEESLL